MLVTTWPILLLAWWGAVAAAPGAELARVAADELEALNAYDGTDRSISDMLARNVQDYFAVYKVPTDRGEYTRVIRTAERATRRFLRELYAEAAERAGADGAAAISTQHVADAEAELIPSIADDNDRRVFFADCGAAGRVDVEGIDLEALRDTGLPWDALRQFAALEPEHGGPTMPVEAPAIQRLTDAVAAYGVLVFRVGGNLAREALAPHLRPAHLREAVETIPHRAAGEVVANLGPAVPQPDRPTYFADVTASSGITFRHWTSAWLARYRRYGGRFPTFSGGGVSAGDINNDGWPDLIFCGGRGCGVFVNRRNGTFADVTDATGLNFPGEARMTVLADFDNDGDRDVFITYARDTNRLYRNTGGLTFADATSGSGLERQGDISGAALAVDYDNDGLLDIFVANFGNYLDKASPWLTGNARNGMPSRLYRNQGGLRFREVTQEAGVNDTGWSQAVGHVDADNDGDQDIYIANDFGRNELLLNNGDGTFTVSGRHTRSDNGFHGMNVSFADLNGDEYADILVTNIWGRNPARQVLQEFNTLLLSESHPQRGLRYRLGHLAELSKTDTGWSWAGMFFDHDHDGDDDLYVVNGLNSYYTFFQARRHPTQPDQHYPYNNDRETNVFYRNDGGRFVDASIESGANFRDANSRGLALLDYDRDGDLDMAVSTFHSHPRLFRNDAPPREHHRLRVKLVGDPTRGCSRDAIGTRVIARGADGLYVWRAVCGGEGYLSMSALPVDIGLGAATTVDLEIHWPGRRRQVFKGVAADLAIGITQGRDDYEVLDGKSAPSENGR